MEMRARRGTGWGAPGRSNNVGGGGAGEEAA